MTDTESNEFLLQAGQSPPENSKKEPDIPRSPPQTRNRGLVRTWFARSANIRPTPDMAYVRWGIHWITPTSIIGLLFLGTASAIAHHIFYSRLHHTTVGSEMRQQWTLWIGAAFSILTKFTLAAAVGVARTQWVWYTLRRKHFSMDSLDSLFGVVSDPMCFVNLGILKHAKATTVMAMAMWVIPIAAILTPGTISVYSTNQTEIVPCTVPSMLFLFDPNPLATPRMSMNIGNDLIATPMGSWSSNSHILRVPGPVITILTLSAYSDSVRKPSNLLPANRMTDTTLNQVCGPYCTYSVTFLAPAISCPEFTSWNSINGGWHNATQFMGRMVYRSFLFQGSSGFLFGANYSFGAALKPSIFLCTPSAARYTIRNVIENRQFHEPVITKVEPVQLPEFKSPAIYPESRFLSQFVLLGLLYNAVERTMTLDDMNQEAMSRESVVDDLRAGMAELGSVFELKAQKMVASLFAFGEQKLSDVSLILNESAIQQTNCTCTEQVVLYEYSATTLVLVYGLAVGCTLVMAVAGFFALGQNGMASSKSISTIIQTTRNPTLDKCIVGGDRLGGVERSEELQKLELQFGALQGVDDQQFTFAMGVKGEILPIKRD